MASEALPIQRSRTPRRPTYRPINHLAERIFFSSMAVLLCVLVFIGFSPTYFRAGLFRAHLASPILHVHGAVFTLWMLLYLIQTALISARRINWHRTFGIAAFCLTPIMIVLGTIVGFNALHRQLSSGTRDAAICLAIPLLNISWFTVLIYASWRARRRPDAHKRLILLATINLVDAALTRIPWQSIRMSPDAGPVIGLGVLVLLLVLYDLFSLHRLHRTTIWAVPVTFAVGGFAVQIGMTQAWQHFAAFLDRTIGVYM